MEIESMFLNSFSIEKKPADICELIEAAIIVGALKHPAEFEKRKNRIFNIIMHPGDHDDLILDDDNDDDISTLDDDDEEEEDSVGDEDGMTKVEEPAVQKTLISTNRVSGQLENVVDLEQVHDCNTAYPNRLS